MVPTDALDRVRRLLSDGDCVLFIGSGLSASTGLPTGTGLARELAADLGPDYDGPLDDLGIVASATEALLGRHHLLSEIQRRFASVKATPTPAHERLGSLETAAIVTTNWDSLLEDAMRGQGKTPTVVASDSDLPFGPRSQVLKLHGDLGRLDTLVVTDFDTLQVPYDRPGLVDRVRSLLTQYSTVFIGFSLADTDFRSTYLQCRQIVGRTLPRSYAVQLNPRPWLVDVWNAQGIQIIGCDVLTLTSTL